MKKILVLISLFTLMDSSFAQTKKKDKAQNILVIKVIIP